MSRCSTRPEPPLKARILGEASFRSEPTCYLVPLAVCTLQDLGTLVDPTATTRVGRSSNVVETAESPACTVYLSGRIWLLLLLVSFPGYTTSSWT